MPAPHRCPSSIGFALLAATAVLAQADGKQGKPPGDRTAELCWALVAEVQQQLRSADPRTIAWGAHRAAEHRLVACEDDLVAALRKFAKDDPDRTRYAANTILDALVQIAGDVPRDELEPFFALEPTVALMLPRDHGPGVLLRVARAHATGSPAWRACGNVLVTARNPDFVADVLRARIAPFVQVHDGEPLRELWPGDSVGCSFDFEHAGWPSFPRYTFSFAPETGAKVLVGDAFPVFVVRDTSASAGRCTCSSEFTLSDARAAWLQHLLGKEHADAARALDRERTLRWRDAASYPANVSALRDTIAADWRAVVTACVGAKLLAAEVAKGLEPDIVLDEWNLLDVRKDTSVPLPDRTVPPRRR
jgi:hypothetical protein